MMFKKGLATLVILLFFGLAVSPSIYANNIRNSNNEEYVEFKTKLVGINGAPSNTVKLTVEQAEELEVVMDEIRIRLESKEARENPYKFLIWGFSELNKFGLFEDGINNRYIQEMFRLWRINTKIMKFLDRLNFDDKEVVSNLDSLSNEFCILEAEVDVEQLGISLNLLPIRRLIITYIIWNILHYFYDYDKPIWSLPKMVFFGATYITFGGDYFHEPSNGWVSTNGLYGNDSIVGDFYGNLGKYGGRWTINYVGIDRFNGLIVDYGLNKYLFGFVGEIKLGREPLFDWYYDKI